MTISKHAAARTSVLSVAAAKIISAIRWIDSNTVRGRAIQQAERMMHKSDAELAELGLNRDNVLQHAFSRYAAG